MTALVFPQNPNTGDRFQNWIWDGARWVPASAADLGGGWDLLNSVSVSNAVELADVTSLLMGYPEYEIQIFNLTTIANNDTAQLRLQINGTFQTSGYLSALVLGGQIAPAAQNATTYIDLNRAASVPFYSGTPIAGVNARLRIANPSDSATIKSVLGYWYTAYGASYTYSGSIGGAWVTGTQPVTGFQLTCAVGPFSATVKVYGRREHGPPAQPIPRGALVLLNTLNFSNQVYLEDLSSFSDQYDDYEIAFSEVIPTVAGVLNLHLYLGGVLQTANYNGYYSYLGSGNSVGYTALTTMFTLTYTIPVGNPGACGLVRIQAARNPNNNKMITGLYTHYGGAGFVGGTLNVNGAVTGIRIGSLYSNANTASGKVKIYGRV